MKVARVPVRRAPIELASGVLRGARKDRLTGLAAEVAFYWVLALPPALVALFSSMGYVTDRVGPGTTARIVDRFLEEASAFLSPDGVETLRDLTTSVLEEPRTGVFVVSVIVALFSASRATRVFVDAVHIAYGVPETRPLVRRRLVALGVTALGVVAALVLLPLIALGPGFAGWIADRTGLDVVAAIWAALYAPAVVVGGGLLVGAVYHLAASARTPLRRDLPGAALALAVWMGGAFVLRVYALVVIERSPVHGAVGGIFVLMLVLYLTALSLLLGAQLNAEVERRWPAATAGSSG